MDPEVQQELFRRIDGINKADSYELSGEYVSNILDSKSEALENEYFKTCWARVITIDGDGNSYYLNSQLGDDGKTPITEPLNIKKNGDYSRGRAGITSISSNFKEFFLKQSTISFLCPDPKEFEEIQEKFLKHGRYVLVEFGWSTRKNIQLDEINTDNLVKFSNNLNQRTKGSRGNYAAICGVITNFNFNQKQDGSYEGTFEVSSMGRNILGQKIKTDGKLENLVNFVSERVREIEEDDNEETKDVVEGEVTEEELANLQKIRNTFLNFHAAIKSLPNVIQDYVDNTKYTNNLPDKETENDTRYDSFNLPQIGTGPVNTINAFQNNIKNLIKNDSVAIKSKNGAAYLPSTNIVNFKTPKDSEENLSYCTWGWFEDYILNSFFAFTSDSGGEDFKTRFFSVDDKEFDADGNVIRNESTKCKSNPNLFSLGLQSVILPGKFKQFKPDSTAESETDKRKFSWKEYFTKTGEIIQGATGLTTRNRERALTKTIEHFNNNDYFEQFDDQGKNQGNIRNMVFEANYLMESFDNAINIDSALMNFWQKVSNDYGGFWRFGIVQDDNTDGKIKIMDLNIGQTNDTNVSEKISKRSEYINWNSDNKDTKDPGKIFRFPLYEKNSFIQDFSLETAYDSEMATMAVFGSNANIQETRGDMGQGYTDLAIRALSLIQNPTSTNSQTTADDLKKQKFDNILKNLQVPVNTNPSQQGASSVSSLGKVMQKLTNGILFKDIPEVQKSEEEIEADIQQSNQYDTEDSALRKGYFWFNLGDSTVQIYASYSGEIMKEFKRTMLYYINKSPDPKSQSNYNVVLPAVPLQLGLTIQGIGGIKIGDLFYIDYLPQVYKKYCHWMVVGVEHEISTTGWTTKLDSRMIVDIPKLIENSKGKLTKTDFTPFVIPPGKQLKDELTRLAEKYGDKAKSSGPKKSMNSFYNDSQTRTNPVNPNSAIQPAGTTERTSDGRTYNN